MDLLRSLPLGLYLEQPVTWLHRLDARVKLAWLMTFLAAPILASAAWRLILVGLLIVITFSALIPARVWRQQMGWLLTLSTLVFVLTAIAPDGLAANSQPRLPTNSLELAEQATIPSAPPRCPWYTPLCRAASPPHPETPQQELPQPTRYQYVLVQQGPFTVTRRSFDLGLRVSTLIFTLIYSTNLYLLTTAPEEITASLEDLMAPLRRLHWPVTEIALTLTLSLRFIPLVLEEVQNLVRAVRTRAINWKKLGLRRAINLWMTLAERLLKNLLLRAEQIASAMKVRGFTSPDRHRVQWHQTRLRRGDWLAVMGLVLLWGARLFSGTLS